MQAQTVGIIGLKRIGASASTLIQGKRAKQKTNLKRLTTANGASAKLPMLPIFSSWQAKLLINSKRWKPLAAVFKNIR